MYLATKIIKGKIHYFLRQSYRKNDIWLSRNLFSLGQEPGEYINYGGGNSFYLSDELLAKVSRITGHDPEDDLELLLWPFVDPEIRLKLEPFYKPERRFKSRKVTDEELAAITDIHEFDRRRLHYHRYGSINQGPLERMRPKMLRVMLNKSRDEREQYFLNLEHALEPDELKQYVYVIFNLKRHFSELIARSMPEGLDETRLDKYFILDLCRLDRDKYFWAGTEKQGGLHDYLQRYVIMFFDYDYRPAGFYGSNFAGFFNRRAGYRQTKADVAMSSAEAGEIFSLSPRKLQAMSRQELTRLYRKKAKKMHPDKGGEHESFVRLTAAYDELMKNR